MTRTRIATAVAALAVAGASITVIVPATFANGNAHGNGGADKPAQCVPGTCPGDPLPGTQDPESYDIGTPPTVDGDVDLGGGDAPVAQ
ncbi:hypothetical protein [Nocardioides marmorisolisilvae]|uniref:Uncharacterized protein n=1 Tax=Nocardioides marmorisolisilvae TaxID=1542737 RepID=A0A3N0DTK3_9ACTN|nr:hypothetical protein [Nocardioides marmorisolisilvae]RNL78930.1 hypothetical protein EFL95_07720 [Nocardioides marmorisolisilvae]